MLKRLLIALFLLPLTLLAYASPGKPAGYVNDFASLLDNASKQSLEESLTQLEKDTEAEVSIVTIPNLGDETIETYAVKLFEEWGIGKKKADNGLLLLISRDERKIRIEVGYGLEPVITDIESAHIISDVIAPEFQQGNYGAGVEKAIDVISHDIRNGEPSTNVRNVIAGNDFIDNAGFFLYVGVILLMWLASILSRSKSWWAGGIIGGVIGLIFALSIYLVIVLIGIGLLFDYIVSRTYQRRKLKGLNPPWWIGGGGHGGFGGGGGFGGFGGGRSGGGGASGGW